jgi:hypothetical protein
MVASAIPPTTPPMMAPRLIPFDDVVREPLPPADGIEDGVDESDMDMDSGKELADVVMVDVCESVLMTVVVLPPEADIALTSLFDEVASSEADGPDEVLVWKDDWSEVAVDDMVVSVGTLSEDNVDEGVVKVVGGGEL